VNCLITEMGTELKAENLVQIKFPNQLIHRILAVLFLDFRQYKLGGIAVVTPSDIGLYFN